MSDSFSDRKCECCGQRFVTFCSLDWENKCLPGRVLLCWVCAAKEDPDKVYPLREGVKITVDQWWKL